MTAAIGSSSVLLGNSGTAYGYPNAAAKSADSAATQADSGSQPTSDSVTLSDTAKAYLATAAASDTAGMAAAARTWFDQQYQDLGISSAMLDGKVAVDFSSQNRDTLSLVASNSQGLFSKDESAAAAQELQSRFNDAMMPHVVIARHTGNYASLYQAASDYLDQAGDNERATATWQSQKQAVQDGLAAARVSFGKAPDADGTTDPVRALLDKTSQSTSSATATDSTSLAANARAMLDAQINMAADAGTDLAFDAGRKTGMQADFSDFDNQTLAVVALNQGASFSSEESRAAKKELDQRTRTDMLNALNGGSVQDSALALLGQYSGMSDAEKSALGYTDEFRNRIIQSYRTISLLQGSVGSSGGSAPIGLASYF